MSVMTDMNVRTIERRYEYDDGWCYGFLNLPLVYFCYGICISIIDSNSTSKGMDYAKLPARGHGFASRSKQQRHLSLHCRQDTCST